MKKSVMVTRNAERYGFWYVGAWTEYTKVHTDFNMLIQIIVYDLVETITAMANSVGTRKRGKLVIETIQFMFMF